MSARSNLIPKHIVDKNGKLTTVMVKRDSTHGYRIKEASQHNMWKGNQYPFELDQKDVLYVASGSIEVQDWVDLVDDIKERRGRMSDYLAKEGLKPFYESYPIDDEIEEGGNTRYGVNAGAQIQVQAPASLWQKMMGEVDIDTFSYAINNSGEGILRKNGHLVEEGGSNLASPPTEDVRNKLVRSVEALRGEITELNVKSLDWANRERNPKWQALT